MQPTIAATQQRDSKILSQWEQNQNFRFLRDPNNALYSILMPSPNVTGNLHIGHGLNLVLQDVIARWRSLYGDDVYWAPGVDHGGIATQALVEDELKSAYDKNRFQLGREAFLQKMSDWKEDKQAAIFHDMKKLGLALPWEQAWFSNDKKIDDTVSRAFIELHRRGLIYRARGHVNWCPCCFTSLSDIEVDLKEEETDRFIVKARLEPTGEDLYFTSVRPELIFSCTALAVSSTDTRYRSIVGRFVRLPLINRDVPVIAVDDDLGNYGNGIAMICPAHSPKDFETALSHDLDIVEAISETGKINPEFNGFAGLDIRTARAKVVESLQSIDALKSEKRITYGEAYCYRCQSQLVPRLTNQWYLKTAQLAQAAIDNVKSGEMSFNDPYWESQYLNWLESVKGSEQNRERQSWWEGACLGVVMGYSGSKDWVISRQIWWGNQIPIWYCTSCGHENASIAAPTACEKCGSKTLEQDTDVLDVWFSNTAWPLTPIGWLEQGDWRNFESVDLTVIGHDILYFWITGTNMVCTELTGKPAFKKVLVHGLIADEHGVKMSKSLGNTINLFDVLDEYGIDAVRRTLVMLTQQTADIEFLRLSRQDIIYSAVRLSQLEAYSNICLSNQQAPDADDIDIEEIEQEFNRRMENLDIAGALEYLDTHFEHVATRYPNGVSIKTPVMSKLLKMIGLFYPILADHYLSVESHELRV